MALTGPTFEDIREELEYDIERLVRELAPDGHVNGKYWIAKNPTRSDKNAGSFYVILRRPGIGVWEDKAAGEKGNIFGLIQYTQGIENWSDVRKWCLRWLGKSDAPESAREKSKRDAMAKQRENDRKQEEIELENTRIKNGKRALGLWLNAQKFALNPKKDNEIAFSGSLVERYFLSRNIDLAAACARNNCELPGAFRFLPEHDYILAEDKGRLKLPCIITLMSDARGQAQCVHRTWLAPNGEGKAEFPDPKKNKPRKMWPGPNGAVMRIAKGDSKRSPEQAAKTGEIGSLIITEGLEDALAVVVAMPEMRVWAAGTLDNIGNVPVHLQCVSDVVVCADNDWDNPQAEKSLEKAIAALRQHQKPVRIVRSPVGKDMNDLLKGSTI